MHHQPKLYNSIIKAGIIAGTLDITAACISSYIRTGGMPAAVFRFIARGAFGEVVKTGGTEMIIAGVLFHYLIAFSFTIAFFLIYPKLKQWLSPYIIITGLAYGLIAWCIMNLIVLPLSKLPQSQPKTSQIITGMLFLMFLIGLPVAIFAKKHYAISRQ
jgi:hypothetical protein